MVPTALPAEAPGTAFTRFLEAGELRVQVCAETGRQIFFPRTICPGTGGQTLEWRPTSGRGTVHSTTVVRQRPDRGGDYNVAIVELAEGARLLTRIEGIAPADVRIGMAVQAMIGKDQAGAPLVLFRVAEAQS